MKGAKLFRGHSNGPVVQDPNADEGHKLLVRNIREYFEYTYMETIRPFFSFPLFKLNYDERVVVDCLWSALASPFSTCLYGNHDSVSFSLPEGYEDKTPKDVLLAFQEFLEDLYIRAKSSGNHPRSDLKRFLDHIVACDTLYRKLELRSFPSLVIKSDHLCVPKKACLLDCAAQQHRAFCGGRYPAAIRNMPRDSNFSRLLYSIDFDRLRPGCLLDKSEALKLWDVVFDSTYSSIPMFYCWLSALIHPDINTWSNRMRQRFT